MNTQSFHFKLSGCGVKRFIFNLSHGSTVNSVSIFSTELIHIEIFSTITHFFIRCKPDLYITMFNFGVLN